MEATCSSEKSADFQGTTLRYIPEDKTLRNHRIKNLKSCKLSWSGIELNISVVLENAQSSDLIIIISSSSSSFKA
jgi:hypothetical protein